jgi:hypothetical protein
MDRLYPDEVSSDWYQWSKAKWSVVLRVDMRDILPYLARLATRF